MLDKLDDGGGGIPALNALDELQRGAGHAAVVPQHQRREAAHGRGAARVVGVALVAVVEPL